MPYVDFLKLKDLTPNLIHYILHCIAMVNEQTSTLEVSVIRVGVNPPSPLSPWLFEAKVQRGKRSRGASVAVQLVPES